MASTFAKYGDNQSYSPMTGISTGNPLMDSMMPMILGNNLLPRPGDRQSVYEAMLLKERSAEFRRMIQQSGQLNGAMQRFGGINGNGIPGQILNSMMLNGNNPVAQFVSKLAGGNPLLAQMSLFSGLTGMSNTAFGTLNNVSLQDTTQMMQILNRSQFMPGRDIQNSINNSQSRISGFTNALQNGNISEQQRRDLQEKIQYEQEQIARDQKLIDKGIKVKPGGLNYEFTRGFQTEDFTKFYNRVADLDLVDGKKYGLDAKQGFERMFGGGKGSPETTGAMDALRALFGSDPDSLASGLNDLVGKGSINMLDAGDAKKIETLAREFRGAAKTAGVAVDSLIDINKQMASLYSQIPGLQGVSGTTISKLTLQGVKAVSTMAAGMSQEEIRKRGGKVQMMQDYNESTAKGLSDEVSQRLFGLYGALDKNAALSPEQRAQAMAELGALGNDPNLTPTTFQSKAFDIGQKYGMDRSRIYSAMTNEEYRKHGQQNFGEQVSAFSSNLVFSQFNNQLNANAKSAFNDPRKRAQIMQAIRNYGYKGEVNASNFASVFGQLASGTGESASSLLMGLGMMNDSFSNTLARSPIIDEQYKKKNSFFSGADYDAKMKEFVDKDSEFSKKFGFLNDSIGSNVLQAMLNGGAIGGKGFQYIKDKIIENENTAGSKNPFVQKNLRVMEAYEGLLNSKKKGDTASMEMQSGFINTALGTTYSADELTKMLESGDEKGIEDIFSKMSANLGGSKAEQEARVEKMREAYGKGGRKGLGKVIDLHAGQLTIEMSKQQQLTQIDKKLGSSTQLALNSGKAGFLKDYQKGENDFDFGKMQSHVDQLDNHYDKLDENAKKAYDKTPQGMLRKKLKSITDSRNEAVQGVEEQAQKEQAQNELQQKLKSFLDDFEGYISSITSAIEGLTTAFNNP